jgi:hypothetical protein
VSEKKEEAAVPRAEEGGEEEPEALDFGKKKKKSKKVAVVAAAEEVEDEDKEDKEGDDDDDEMPNDVSFVDEEGREVFPWAGTDRDYSYDEVSFYCLYSSVCFVLFVLFSYLLLHDL